MKFLVTGGLGFIGSNFILKTLHENEGFDNSIWLLFPPWEELEISTRDTFRLSKDIPNRDKSILRFFSKIKKEE